MRRPKPASTTSTIAPTRFALRDLADEALSGLLQRPGRSALTALGTLLGVWAFVAVLGLTATAAGQISKRFTVLAATEVTIEVGESENGRSGSAFPDDAAERLQALNGTVAAGLMWTVDEGRVGAVSAVPLAGARNQSTGDRLEVRAVAPGALEAMHPRVGQGRLFDQFHNRRSEHVALLGAAAAHRLGITRLDAQPAIFVGGVPLTVIGIIDDVQRHADVLLTVLVPANTAQALWGQPQADPKMIVETRLGAASLIGRQAPLALRPDRPELFKVTVPPDPRELREGIATDLDVLFLLLAVVSLTIGAVGIANTTLIAVLERVPEIGLRRSLGARPVHVAAQFLTESTVLGTLGGLVGTVLGIGTVLAVAIARDWTAVIEPWATLPAPFIGMVTGLLAGLYPCVRAARIEPVEALRR